MQLNHITDGLQVSNALIENKVNILVLTISEQFYSNVLCIL